MSEVKPDFDHMRALTDEVVPHINSVFTLQQVRSGPHFGVEHQAARAAIAMARAEGK